MLEMHVSPFWKTFHDEQAPAYAKFGPYADELLALDLEARIKCARIVGDEAAAEASAIFEVKPSGITVALDLDPDLIPADRQQAANAAASMTRRGGRTRGRA